MSYLKFEDRGTTPNGKTRRWVVLNSISGVVLGLIQWAPNFRKYTFESFPGMIYDACCLRDLSNFVETKTKEHKT